MGNCPVDMECAAKIDSMKSEVVYWLKDDFCYYMMNSDIDTYNQYGLQ